MKPEAKRILDELLDAREKTTDPQRKMLRECEIDAAVRMAFALGAITRDERAQIDQRVNDIWNREIAAMRASIVSAVVG